MLFRSDIEFKDYTLEDCIEFEKGNIFFPSEDTKKRFEMRICNKCPFPECKLESFRDLLQYKKHLSTRHKKYLWYGLLTK